MAETSVLRLTQVSQLAPVVPAPFGNGASVGFVQGAGFAKPALFLESGYSCRVPLKPGESPECKMLHHARMSALNDQQIMTLLLRLRLCFV
jgi:hypothetical protein